MSDSQSNGGNVYVAYKGNSYLFGGNAPYVEEMYENYLDNPGSVPENWRGYFDALQNVPAGDGTDARDVPHQPVINAFAERAKQGGTKVVIAAGADSDLGRKRVAVQQLIAAYRNVGARWADLDPLKRAERDHIPELELSFYGFADADLETIFNTSNTFFGKETMSLRELLNALRETYCGSIGAEYMYITDQSQKRWWQERLEGSRAKPVFNAEKKKHILDRLTAAEGLERFLHTKYVGQKRFSLEGGESFIASMDELIRQAGQVGIQEIVIGMAHRGRLNVLVNTLGKMPKDLFAEFDHTAPEELPAGDVKYHQGFSSDVTTPGGPVHLSLAFNPSHLEIVNPVVEGSVRARMDRRGDPLGKQVLPLLLHGDAAFAGQGVVAECFGLSALRGHRTGGSIHVIINNQIGFTTNPRFSRSSPYPSDVAKMIEAPIFHCNGDDPEAVVYAAKIATEFRQLFGKPVVIDMICYRRFGHNESDEPAFTQPIMYRKIRSHPTTLQIYSERLVKDGVLTAEEIDAMRAEVRARLDEEFEAGQAYKPNKADWLDGKWSGLKQAQDLDDPRRGQTGLPIEEVREIGAALTRVPEGFNVHRTIRRFLDNRKKMFETGEGVDWATAEALAFGSLLLEGHAVRLSGQDCERGTFSQRHSVLYDQEDESRLIPLNNLREGQARYEVINSMLSEEAVLGFEYGYTLTEPGALTLWEAQFGDFANGAQVVFDQFLSSGERKWLRMSGLVCLLPHGYEGQGPEHSSARLERFLQMCAEDNMQVANCTTPANYFHILRRQLKRDFRKPLILMTPKSLLRHKRAVSRVEEFADGSSFHRLLWDDAQLEGYSDIKLVADDKIRRVIMCSGKVYYDLFEEREKRGIDDVYLLRVEQLYPFPTKALVTELARFKDADFVWCQEEPKNMGSWFFVQSYLEWVLNQIDAKHARPRYIGRAASAATATGLMSKHAAQLQAFLDEAFADQS